MKCQDIRAAIDTMSKRAPMSHEVKSHTGACTDCSRYADQTTALLSLLSAQPRVEAPADFDFRLRARIARAQAEPRGVMATIEALWSKSFSWGQAASAVATLALAVTLTTLYVDRTEEIVAPAQDVATMNAAPEKITTAIETAISETKSETMIAGTPAAMTQRTSARSAARAVPPVEVERVKASLPDALANNSDTLRVYNRERGQIIAASTRTTLIGAEAPAANLAKNASFVPSI